MKITKRRLRRIIQEELDDEIDTSWLDDEEDEEWGEIVTSNIPQVQAIDNLLRADTPGDEVVSDDSLSSFVIGPVKTSKDDYQPVRVWRNNYLGMLGQEVYVEDSAYDDSGNLHTSEDLVQWLKTQGAKIRE